MLISRSLYPEYTLNPRSSPISLIEPAPVTSLWYFLHKIPDCRRSQGKRHNLPTVLILSILAICSGATSYQAIAEWPRNYQEQLKEVVPFLLGHLPDKSTFHRIFANLDIEAFEEVLGSWFQTITHLEKGEGIALDGKTTARDKLHLVAAFAHQAKTVLFQKGTDTKGKGLAVAPQVLENVYVKGRVITADALHAQRDFCETIVKSGGGYVVVVKGNQEKLQEDITLFFESLPESLPFKAKLESFQTLEKSKGRVEERTVWVSGDQGLVNYLSWPGLTHVFKCQRKITQKDGRETKEIVYGIASLLQGYSSAKNINQYLRGHWSIENNLHRVRDVSFNEDKSTIRTRGAPEVMAALKNLVINIFQRGQVKSYPQAFRRFSAHPEELFVFLGLNQVNQRVVYA